MNVTVTTKHCEHLPDNLSRRCRRAFRRVAERISSVDLLLRPETKKKGCPGTSCVLEIKLAHAGSIHVSAWHQKASVAISKALRRADQNLLKLSDRWNTRRRMCNKYLAPSSV